MGGGTRKRERKEEEKSKGTENEGRKKGERKIRVIIQMIK